MGSTFRALFGPEKSVHNCFVHTHTRTQTGTSGTRRSFASVLRIVWPLEGVGPSPRLFLASAHTTAAQPLRTPLALCATVYWDDRK